MLVNVPTLGGQTGLGKVQETQALVEATHLLDQVGHSWWDEGRGGG